MKTLQCLALLALTAVITTAAAAEIYRWTDAAGNVHYTDRPAENVDAELIRIESRPTDPARIEAMAKARREARAAIGQARDSGQDDSASREEQRRIAEERAEKCNLYRERLQRFLQSRRLYREGENGERIYLDEQEMQEARNRVQEQVQEFCNA